MIKIQSFDVFDTCLTRKNATPTSVFYDIARAVFNVKGITTNNGVEEEFVANRIVAEQEARRKSNRDDVTLEMIWRQLAVQMNWSFEPWMPQCEMKIEERLLSPISEMRERVNAARTQGYKIIFVSDMYMPSVFIRDQLIKHGFASEGDSIYVSGEIGLSKANGNLFRHVLEIEQVGATELLHIGDNIHSDHRVPKKLGIRVDLFTNASLNKAEVSILKSSLQTSTASRIAGSMRSFRMIGSSNEQKNVHSLTAEFIGPFIMGFAAWVLQRAQANKIRRLYFFSRDCQLLHKAAVLLSPRFGGIECRYLHVSRQALFLPSAESISDEAMPWIGQALEKAYLKNILAKLELKYEHVEEHFNSWTGLYRDKYVLKTKSDWEMFWNIIRIPKISDNLHNLIQKRRNSAQTYFKQAGMLDDISWAVVDFGWVLQGQSSLQKLLISSGWHGEIEGYYLGLMTKRAERRKAGKAEAIFYQPPFDGVLSNKFSEVFRRIPLLEHIVGLADHATVNHYNIDDDGNAKPVSIKTVSKPVEQLSNALHEKTVQFINEHQYLVEDLKQPEFCRELLGTLVENFFNSPSKEAVLAVKNLNISMDQNEMGAKPIVTELSWADTLLPLLPGREPFNKLHKTRTSVWPEGAFTLASPHIQLIRKNATRLAAWRSKLARK